MLGPDEVVAVISREKFSKNEVVPTNIQQMYGIIPRAIFAIFEEINKQIVAKKCTFEMSAIYFEIYAEQYYDLLSSKTDDESRKMRPRESKDGRIFFPDGTTCNVLTPDDIFQALKIGQKKRSVASTKQNDRSSRSHTILVLDITQTNPDGSKCTGRLNLVDLAGSERIEKTGATG